MNCSKSAREKSVRIFFVSFATTDGGKEIVVGAILNDRGLEIGDVGFLAEVCMSGEITAVTADAMLCEESLAS